MDRPSGKFAFTNVREIGEMEVIIKAYRFKAIEVEKAGLKVELKKPTEFIIAKEFQKKPGGMPALKTAFQA